MLAAFVLLSVLILCMREKPLSSWDIVEHRMFKVIEDFVLLWNLDTTSLSVEVRL